MHFLLVDVRCMEAAQNTSIWNVILLYINKKEIENTESGLVLYLVIW